MASDRLSRKLAADCGPVQASVAVLCLALAAAAVLADGAAAQAAAPGRGDLDAAIRLYTQEIADGKLAAEDLAVAHYRRGTAYGREAQYDRAVQDFAAAIRLKPNFAEAYYNRGTVYERGAAVEQALSDFDEALRLKPDFAEAYNNRGNAYARLGRDELAIRDYDQALRIEPNFVEALNNRGYAYGREGRYDRAIRDFDQAIVLNAEGAAPFGGRGADYAVEGPDGAAAQDYDRAIRLKSEVTAAFKGLGVLHFDAGRYSEAESNLRVASNSDPKNPYHTLWLYLALSRQKKDGLAELAGRAPELDLSGWPGPIVRFYLGQGSARSVLAAADRGAEERRSGRLCEADFYLGENDVLAGKRAAAAQLFRAAVAVCANTFIELAGAKAELQSLDQAAR